VPFLATVPVSFHVPKAQTLMMWMIWLCTRMSAFVSATQNVHWRLELFSLLVLVWAHRRLFIHSFCSSHFLIRALNAKPSRRAAVRILAPSNADILPPLFSSLNLAINYLLSSDLRHMHAIVRFRLLKPLVFVDRTALCRRSTSPTHLDLVLIPRVNFSLLMMTL